jgi:hypothetical protein
MAYWLWCPPLFLSGLSLVLRGVTRHAGVWCLPRLVIGQWGVTSHRYEVRETTFCKMSTLVCTGELVPCILILIFSSPLTEATRTDSGSSSWQQRFSTQHLQKQIVRNIWINSVALAPVRSSSQRHSSALFRHIISCLYRPHTWLLQNYCTTLPLIYLAIQAHQHTPPTHL